MKKSTKTLTASDESKNLHGFTVLTSGIDITDFIKNPVLLYIHDYDKLLGLCEDVRFEGELMLYVPSFDETDDYALKQYSKVEQDILRGSSIGIVPIEFDEANNIMKRCSLKEISLTPVPSNRNAIALYNAEGKKLSASEAKEYLLSLQPQTEDLTQKQSMKQNLINALVALCVQAGHTINLSAQSDDAEIESAIKKVGEKITGLSSKNNELTTKLDGIELAAKLLAENELKMVLDTAQEQKLLTAETRPGFEALGKIDLSALKTTLSAMKPVSLVEVPKPGEKTPVGREAWTYDEFALSAPADLERMQTADPDKFQKLLTAKLAKARNEHSIEA